jgi:hypothetical protein
MNSKLLVAKLQSNGSQVHFIIFLNKEINKKDVGLFVIVVQ